MDLSANFRRLSFIRTAGLRLPHSGVYHLASGELAASYRFPFSLKSKTLWMMSKEDLGSLVD